MEHFWQDCLERFKQELSSQQFNTWIKPIKFETTINSIRLIAPNRFVQQWIKEKFLGRIEQLAEEYFPAPMVISLELSNAQPSETTQNPLPDIQSALQNNLSNQVISNKLNPNSRLNPQFTFENFVIGKANQLARAAALQVAENPGKAYNPLFIYGGVGLGKTHLIQAIGNLVQERTTKQKSATCTQNDTFLMSCMLIATNLLMNSNATTILSIYY